MAALAAPLPPAPIPAVVVEEPWHQDLGTDLICRECKEDPPNIVEEYSSGDMVCGDCGLILGSRIVDTGSEWRTFSNDDQNSDDPSRVGAGPNQLLNGDQLTTEVAMGDGKLSKELRRAQSKTINDKNNKNLLSAYNQITTFCRDLDLPHSLVEHTQALYKELSEESSGKIIKSKSLDVIVSGLIFIVCREHNAGRTFREIHATTRVSKKEIGKVFKIIAEWRQNKLANSNAPTIKALPNAATSGKKCADLVIRFNAKLTLPTLVKARITTLAEKVDSMDVLAGRSPLSAAGAVIYFMTCLMAHDLPIKEIATITGVSDSTIKTAYALLFEVKDQIVDAKWLKDGKSKMENLPSM